MNSRLETKVFKVTELADLIGEGQLVLADFQRDFDWTEPNIRSFLATILMAWPAGSILLVEGRPGEIEVRGFEDGPDPTPPVAYTVLDGQQRLTSLFYALHDRGPTVYAVRASALLEGDVEALENGIESFPRANWDDRFRDAPWEGEDGWVPLYALRSSTDYFAWREQVMKGASEGLHRTLGLQLSALYRDRLARVHGYDLPAVLVGADLDEGSVARIFERLNRKGLTLGSFDLVVARVYEPHWNLRLHWEEATLEDPLLDRFLAQDGLPVLQTISLAKVDDVRQRAVLDLPRPVIHDAWPRAVAAVTAALSFLREECGVARPEWLPYRAILLVLSGVAFNDYELVAHRDLLRRWFFSRAFSLRFDAAANTRTVEDYWLLRDALERGGTFGVDPANADLIRVATRRKQAALWRAFVCVLAHRSRQGIDGEPLSGDPEDVVVASLSPRRIDTAEGEGLHLRVLSMVLANRRTAAVLRRGGLREAVQPSLLRNEADIDEALEAQLLPPLSVALNRATTSGDILESRFERLAHFLSEEVGQDLVSVPSSHQS